ncbi:MAG: hypothetical protein HND52_08270 [Ignavibacteriae bacterium]|nr:hypothetical protein [Ignavibacteriota bacterium]NOG97944.1 hypothetical protein [Ignavibacteriota bacterium]
MKNIFAISFSILFIFSGCSVIGLGIGIYNHEDPEYKVFYHLDLLKELTPGTKIILELNDGEKVKGKFIYFEEQTHGENFQNDSIGQKVFWEISIKTSDKYSKTYLSYEVRTIKEVINERNYAVPIGLGIGLAVDVLVYFYIKSLDLNFGG